MRISKYKKCNVKGCTNNPNYKLGGRKGYCNKHVTQLYSFGHILKRSRFDNNRIINHGKYYEICLYTGVGEQQEIARTKIDKEDFEKVKDYHWHLAARGYAMTHAKNRKMIYLHQLIFGKAPKGYEIDHKDINPLNNRRNNLRLLTHQENCLNNKKNIWKK
jgi:hypothetical protein